MSAPRRKRAGLALLGIALAASPASAEERTAEPAPPAEPAPDAGALALHVGGRLQFDHYSYLAAGAGDAGLQPTFLLKRLNFELSGRFARRWQLFLQGDLAPAGLDPAQSPVQKLTAAIVILSYRIAPALNVQVGQLLTPVTLDHRLLSKERVILETGLVQQLGTPSPVEIGAALWGETAGQLLAYELGVFNGDGANRWSPDGRADLIGRIAVRPLVAAAPSLRGVQLGGSARLGSRDPARVTYDAPGLATQGGFRFWRPIYAGADGPIHIVPAGRQLVIAAEARIPIDRLELMSEVVHVRNGTREPTGTGAAARTGTLAGTAAYAQLGVWALGSRAVLAPGAAPARALQLVARGEVLRARYESGRARAADAPSQDGAIRVNALLLGAKYWWNPYIRVSANYCAYHFPESGPVMADPDGATPGQTARQRAVAPGNTLGPGASEAARGSHALHELLVRLELGF